MRGSLLIIAACGSSAAPPPPTALQLGNATLEMVAPGQAKLAVTIVDAGKAPTETVFLHVKLSFKTQDCTAHGSIEPKAWDASHRAIAPLSMSIGCVQEPDDPAVKLAIEAEILGAAGPKATGTLAVTVPKLRFEAPKIPELEAAVAKLTVAAKSIAAASVPACTAEHLTGVTQRLEGADLDALLQIAGEKVSPVWWMTSSLVSRLNELKYNRETDPKGLLAVLRKTPVLLVHKITTHTPPKMKTRADYIGGVIEATTFVVGTDDWTPRCSFALSAKSSVGFRIPPASKGDPLGRDFSHRTARALQAKLQELTKNDLAPSAPAIDLGRNPTE